MYTAENMRAKTVHPFEVWYYREKDNISFLSRSFVNSYHRNFKYAAEDGKTFIIVNLNTIYPSSREQYIIKKILTHRGFILSETIDGKLKISWYN